MDSPILKEITKFLHERKKQRRNAVLFGCMALVAVVGTAAALRMVGQAMTRKEKALVCDLQVHEHTDDCYDDDKNLICGLADYVVHVHNDDCYDANGDLVCQLPEIKPHEHTDKCYEEEKVLVCTEEEGDGHIHTKDCYETVQGDLICGLDEHEHDDSCYDEDGELICEKEEHEHTDDCYDEEEILVCGQEEGDGGHTHTDACYETQEVLVCGELELHTHDEKKCYDKDGNLICDKIVLEEHVHSDELGCFEIREAVTEADVEREYFSEESETEEPGDVSATESGEASEDEKIIFTTEDDGEETEEPAENAESAEDVSATEPEASQITKTYVGEGYNVTATYTEEAGLPEEAELIAVQITPESDSERYAKRAAEYKEALGDENASPKALFNIGFYVNGEEVEPKAPVTITIQFLDENGLPEGTPVTVVHFSDAGNEVLDGGEMEDGSTSFQMGSFSDAMVGTGTNMNEPLDIEEAETGAVYLNLDHTFPYENDAFHIDFHITGQVKLPEGVELPAASTDKETSEAGGETAEASQVSEEGEEAGEVSEETESGAIASEAGAIYTTTGEISEETEESAVENESAESADELAGTEGEDMVAGGIAEDAASTYKDLELKVEQLDEDSEEYKAFEEFVAEKKNSNELLSFEPMSYSLIYQGEALDLTNCEVTANFQLTEAMHSEAQAMMAQAEEAITGEEASLEEGDYEITFIVSALSTDEPESVVSDLGSTKMGESDALSVQMGSIVFAARAEGDANPKYKVQYYANLAILDETGSNALPVIDTSDQKLPGNRKGTSVSPNGNAIKNIYVNDSGTVKTTVKPTEVYSAREFEYLKAPSLNYVNALIENTHYKMKEIWVLKDGRSEDSVNKNDWDIYPDIEVTEEKKIDSNGEEYSVSYYTYQKTSNTREQIHFTNRDLDSEGASKTGTYIYISENTTIRLLYDTTEAQPDIKAAFYDYDITSGHMYTDVSNAITNSGSGITATGSQKDSTLYYTYTKEAGINSAGNYTGSGTKLAFGNVNTGTTLGENLWNGNLLNKYNGTQSGHPTVDGSYQGCTFGLVTGLKDGKIQYASGVSAPKLFNEGDATGKTSYDNGEYSLKFNRLGDTYTLTAVNGTNVTGLESFGHPSPYSGLTHTHIWTNDFWPMDSADSYGTDGHDLKFGSYAYRGNRAFAGSSTTGEPGSKQGSTKTYPYSDDGKDHNSYFGMQYSVEFELTKDYVGPLEYYFFGDDDMWVFLDNKLVCDIGGVHSSVGEYVNLWDYLNKGSEGKHTLSFFYTERGASGSTCWMQFTLPSVSTLTPETTDEDFGHLEIHKDVRVDVKGNEYTPEELYVGKEQMDYFENKEFTFKLTILGLVDDYTYIKYDKNGNEETGAGGIIKWNKIHDGQTFTLKDGEYIAIRYLPKNTKYTVTELTENDGVEIQGVIYDATWTKNSAGSEYAKINAGEPIEITGNVPRKDTDQIYYKNVYATYELPKTGGPGTTNPYTIACLLCLLGAGGAGFLYRKKFRERRV